jgi:hypothetical protein
MAWCSCAPRHSDFNVDVQSFGALTLDMSEDALMNSVIASAERPSTPLTPIPLATDDEYDPRNPEFIIQATPEEAGAKNANLVREQISHLKSMLARRKDDRTPDRIIDHYEKVLEELGRVLEPGEQGDTVLSPTKSPKTRRRLFADVSGEAETSLSQESNLSQLPPSPVRARCGRVQPSLIARPGIPDRAPSLRMNLSPPPPCQPVSPTEHQLPDHAHHPLDISSSISPLDGGIRLPRESRHTVLFPSPRSQGMKMKKPHVNSEVPCDDCSGSNFNFPLFHTDKAVFPGGSVRIGTVLDHIQDHIHNFTFARMPLGDYLAETTKIGLLNGTSSETSHVTI